MLTEDDVVTILVTKFGNCGCADDNLLIEALTKILSWAQSDIEKRPRYETLFKEEVTFYTLSGILDHEDFLEHGCSIRVCWITEKGKELLAVLESRYNKN